MAEATRYIGYPYVWGGSSPDTSFDCSGYICWVYTRSGCITFPEQQLRGFMTSVRLCQERKLDPEIWCFTGTYASAGAVSHVGIYVGGSRMLHCGSPIGYADLYFPY